MPLSLEQALDTSTALEERIAEARDVRVRTDLERRKAAVDFTAFDLFKQGGWEQLGTVGQHLAKPLAWGVGLGLPALGAGHLLMRDARHQTEQTINHARNQALIAALGLGGANAIKGLMAPNQREETNELTLPEGNFGSRNVVKLSTDRLMQKLAAAMLLDNILEKQYDDASGEEKTAVVACLFLNRIHGTALLKELAR
jgi:hypothetical protein